MDRQLLEVKRGEEWAACSPRSSQETHKWGILPILRGARPHWEPDVGPPPKGLAPGEDRGQAKGVRG